MVQNRRFKLGIQIPKPNDLIQIQYNRIKKKKHKQRKKDENSSIIPLIKHKLD
jgi:hypothetical protein